ncbi:MAG: aminotransferase class V-fold PLP-dependent enzyme [Anaerolineaceae bacterium]|nr:aminotransferase class V-fold PLP-dependent enzyme [Anaerolineaceae bacterium]
MTESLRETFLLDPEITYLNHGSFGACPRPVFERYQELQRELELNPVSFVQAKTAGYLRNARRVLGEYLNTDANNLVFFPNPTHAANMVIRSLDLKPGDEILTSNYEYNAMNNTWEFYCERHGAKYIHQEFPLPVASSEEWIESLWEGVTEKTRMIFLSHITSPTALIYPIDEICRRAKEAGILTFIDGAHAVSQLDLDLDAMGCDYYTGACHKWLCSPKGAGFIYVEPKHQDTLLPIVISIGWEGSGKAPHNDDPPFIYYQQYQGTRDISAFLSVPAAIEFQKSHDWDSQRKRCHQLAVETQKQISKITGMAPLTDARLFGQFVTIPLPKGCSEKLNEVFAERKIVVPVFPLAQIDCDVIRVSYQAYNDEGDLERLVEALKFGLEQGIL